MADYYVSNGKVSSGLIVNGSDCLVVISGGKASSTTVNQSGRIDVGTNGSADWTTLNDNGDMRVLAGGTATRIMLHDASYLDVYSGGFVNSTTIDGSGSVCPGLRVLSGGVARNTTVNSGGNMTAFGIISNTTVYDYAYLWVYSGCTATNIMATSGAYLRLDVTQNTYITGTTYDSPFKIANGMISSCTFYGGILNIKPDGMADGVTLVSEADFWVSSGGVVKNTTAGSRGGLWIEFGGKASNTTINSGGSMDISAGGIADSVTLNYSGILKISSGGTATNVFWTPGQGTMILEEGANIVYASRYSGVYYNSGSGVVSSTSASGRALDYSNRTMYVMSGGTAKNTTVRYYGSMYIWSGGVASGVAVSSGGSLMISSGGTATNIQWTPCEGDIFVYDGGQATFASQYSGVYFGSGNQLVSNAQVMDSKQIGWAKTIYVMSGGTANNTSTGPNENYNCSMFIWSGGTANNTKFYNRGSMFVWSGGTVNGISLDFANDVRVYAGGVVNDTVFYSQSTLYVLGGVVNNTTFEVRGSMYVYSGGVANGVNVNHGFAQLHVYSGGKITGQMNFDVYGTISAYEGATLDFDISGLAPGNESARVHNFNYIQGTPFYTITVAGDQANGDYSLASGVSGFDSTVSVVNTAGKELGTLTVGTTSNINGSAYTLKLVGTNLTLSVENGAAVPPDPGTPVVSSSGADVLLANVVPQAEYMYGCTPTAVGMILGYYDLHGYSGGGFTNLIAGAVDSLSRGTDGNAYDMDAFDTVLGQAIASEEYVYRFVSRNGVETTPAQELEYAFKSDNKTLNTDVWNCIADYLGTGQYWRGNGNLSTTVTYGSLNELLSGNYRDVRISSEDASRTIRYIDESMIYGLALYVESRGYKLDYSVTGTYQVDVADGSFTFAQYMNEINAGRPVLVSIEGHSMVGYGYNADTQEIIFDDCYESGQRMAWGGTYSYAGANRKLQSISVIALDTGTADAGPKQPAVSAKVTNAADGRTVTVTASFSDDSTLREFSLDGTNWQPYTGPLKFSGNGTVYFRGSDASGNVSLVAKYDVEGFIAETIPEGAEVVSGKNTRTVSSSKDVYLKIGASVTAAHPGALQLTGNGLTVTLGGDNSLSCTSIRNAGILFGDDPYWVDYYGYGPHYDGTVNFNGANISFYSAVSNCITAAGIIGNNLTVNFNGDASGAEDITFESTNPSSGAGDIAGGIIADGDLVINGTFGGDVNSHFDFSPVASDYKRYGTLYGFSAGGNLTVNGDISGNLFQSGISTLGSYAYGLCADGDLSVSGVLSGVIASTAENYAIAIRGSKVNVMVSGIVFAGKSSAANNMTTLIGKLENWDSNKTELLGLAGNNYYAVYAGENSEITFKENALIVGNTFLNSNSVLTVSDAACVYGDITSYYYSGNKVVLKLNSKSLNGTRITSSAWSSGVSLVVDAGDITENGSYGLVEANGLSGQMSLTLSVSGQETTLKVGQTAKIGDADYKLGLDNNLLSLSVSGLTPAPATKPVKFDVDGNGVSDVMFVWTGYNYAHGYWMNGNANNWRSTYAVHPAEWENLGCHDMNGDGKADSVLVGNIELQTGKGAYIGYYLNGEDTDNNWVNIDYLNNEAGVTWKNKVGNLTGNENANSIIWYAPDMFTLGAWTDGSSQWVLLNGSFGSEWWKMAGCGDFDGDGKDSVLMSGYDGQFLYSVGLDGVAHSHGSANWWGWEVRAIGDFAGDGKDDIVLFHSSLGAMALLVDGNADNYVSLGQLDPNDWFVVGAGDYNGDKKDDLLVRQKSTGMLGYYNACDTSEAGWVEMGRGVDLNWTVIA